MTQVAICVRERNPSLARMRPTWVATVFELRLKCCAIPALVNPIASRSATCCSRELWRMAGFSCARPRRNTKDAKDTGSRFALAVGGLAIGCRRPALPGSPLADVHHHVEQMGDLAIGTAQRVDLPVPAAGLASFAPREDAKLAELEALEVTGLGRAADLAHDVEDAALGSRRKNIGSRLSLDRQLFRREPVLPDLVGISKVKRLVAVRDVESDRERVEQPAKDNQGVRRRGRLEDRSEASYRRLRLVQVGSPGERSDDFASTNAMLHRA